jgi:hypothetical protein
VISQSQSHRVASRDQLQVGFEAYVCVRLPLTVIVFWAQDLAKGAGARLEAAKEAGEAAAEVSPEVAQRMASLPAKLKELQGQVRKLLCVCHCKAKFDIGAKCGTVPFTPLPQHKIKMKIPTLSISTAKRLTAGFGGGDEFE